MNKECCIIMHSIGGGAEKMALLLARQLVQHGWKASIVCLRHLPELHSVIPAGVDFAMPRHPGIFSRLEFLRRAVVMTRRASAVVGSLELQSMLAASLLAPGRAVGWLHKDISGYLQGKACWYRLLYRNLLGIAVRYSRTTICVSDGILRSCHSLWPHLASRFQRLYNPLDLDAIRQAAEAALPPEVDAFMQSGPVILAVGRLEWEKNFSLLLEAHALLRRRNLTVRCCIAGEGSERSLLEEKIQMLGTVDSVLLPGFLNPYPLMQRAQVLALSSRFEGMPLVIAEALTLGLPVVAVDCPSGPAELLEHGRTGMLVEAEATALADGLEEALTHTSTQEEKQKRQQRAADFSLDKLLPRWLAILENKEMIN